MKKLIFLGAILAAIVAFSGCETTKHEPGSCKTVGNFSSADVSKDYVRMVCQDWATMLFQNCVSINGLPLNPTTTDVALYCDDRVDQWKADNDGKLGFQIDHSCNFIDNPSFECSQYATAQTALISAPLKRRQVMSAQISNSSTLTSSSTNVKISLEGILISPQELTQ